VYPTISYLVRPPGRSFPHRSVGPTLPMGLSAELGTGRTKREVEIDYIRILYMFSPVGSLDPEQMTGRGGNQLAIGFPRKNLSGYLQAKHLWMPVEKGCAERRQTGRWSGVHPEYESFGERRFVCGGLSMDVLTSSLRRPVSCPTARHGRRDWEVAPNPGTGAK